MYYMGESFDKKKNKQYKTLDGAKKAADKEGLAVFDEDGVKVHPLKVKLTDDVPDGALEKNADGSTNVYDEDGNVVGTMTEEEVQQLEDGISEDDIRAAQAAAKAEDAEAAADKPDAAQDEPKDAQTENVPPDSVEAVQGKIKRVFDGKLRLRRAPSMDEGAICGVSLFNTKTVVKHHVVAGVAFYETLDGYFVKDEDRLVKFIPAE